MDPFTLGLIGAALFAAYRIKRGAAPPPRPRVETPEPEPPPLGFIPPHVFGGALPPPVTSRAITRERLIEGQAEQGRGRERLGEEPAAPSPVGIASASARAQQAIASSPAADVVGQSAPSQRAAPQQFYSYVPPGGWWPGGYYLYTVGQPGAPTVARQAPRR